MADDSIDSLKSAIRDVPDFPKPGILFKDITTLLRDATLLRRSADLLTEMCAGCGADAVVAVESRGFILGGLLADRLGVGFVPVRKPGKLPWRTRLVTYDLEYGQDSLAIHEDALLPGEKALIVDDVLATGGTARATADLVEGLGGRVAALAFLVELTFLRGRERLPGHEVRSLIRY
jgi:adenine phosphoribosyltransferase